MFVVVVVVMQYLEMERLEEKHEKLLNEQRQLIDVRERRGRLVDFGNVMYI